MRTLTSHQGSWHRSFVASSVSEARIRTLVLDETEEQWTTGIAERSPLGARAVRIRALGESKHEVACDRLERRLRGQSWVDAALSRPPNVYLRVETEALCSWIVSALREGSVAAGRASDHRSVTVRRLDPEQDERSLHAFRQVSVTRSLLALLRSRTFDSAIGGSEEDTVHPMFVVCRDSAPVGPDVVHVTVAGVDVPQGPLRARHGGSVDAQDVLDDILDRVLPEHFGPESASASGRLSEALLEFVLLRCDRTRRVALNDGKLVAGAKSFAGVVEALRGAEARGGRGDASQERAQRALALELDVLPVWRARAVNALDASLALRFVCSLASAIRSARGSIAPTHPLWPAARHALETAFALTAIDFGDERLIERELGPSIPRGRFADDHVTS